VKTPDLVMQQVYSLTSITYYGAVTMQDAERKAQDLVAQVAARLTEIGPVGPGKASIADALEAFAKKVATLAGSTGAPAGAGRGGGRGGAAPASPAPETLASAASSLVAVSTSLQAADVQPTANQLAAIASAREIAGRVIARWNTIKGVDLPALNVKLKSAGMQALVLR
jgi:hypothetical protein